MDNANAQQVTLMEVYRLVEGVSRQVDQLDKKLDTESHALRNKIGAHATEIALLKDRSGTSRTLTIGGVLGAWSALVAWIFSK